MTLPLLDKITQGILILAASTLLSHPETCVAEDYPGLPTRSQNPLLQGYLIPAVPMAAQEGWAFAHNLYITNTFQTDTSSSENLVIDVENTRYDFQAAYPVEAWTIGITLSLISNQSGFLDQTILGWHDFFGLPQGGREQTQNDQINLVYQQNGNDIININNPSSGLGDIQLSASYALSSAQSLWFIVELPSSQDSLLISNQQTDVAAGYSSSHRLGNKITGYGSLGLSLLSNDGILKDYLKREILFGQYGLIYHYQDEYQFLTQADFHSSMLKDSDLEALDHSLQAQFGLRLPHIFKHHQLDIFFSEDIWPGHAPDISFAMRLSPVLHD